MYDIQRYYVVFMTKNVEVLAIEVVPTRRFTVYVYKYIIKHMQHTLAKD